MKLIKNKILPFGRFYAINLYGCLFYKGKDPNQITLNHELIHEEQAKDFCKWKPLGYTIYYLIYCIVWLIELIRPPYNKAYSDSCFEKEAYLNQNNLDYIKFRKRFACWNKKYWKNK